MQGMGRKGGSGLLPLGGMDSHALHSADGADAFGLELSGIDPATSEELRKIKRNREMAGILAEQGSKPLQGRMVGNVYVRPSLFQGIAQLGQNYLARKDMGMADEAYKALVDKRGKIEQDAFGKFSQGYFGSPEKSETLYFDDQNVGSDMTKTTPAVVPDANAKQQAVIEYMRSQSPTAKTILPMLQDDIKRQRDMQEFRGVMKGAIGGGQAMGGSQLTGFEPIPNGVPGQQGMVGDPQNLIQDVAMNPDMSNEDKQAAIAQIRQQSAGAGGGQIDPRTLLLSGNKMAMDVGKLLESEKARADAAKLAREERLRAQKELMQMRFDAQNEMKQMAGAISKAQPYFSPFDSSEGAMVFDHRTGRMVPAVNAAGAPIKKSTSDPTLQGDIASAKKLGQAKAERAINMAGLGDVIKQAEELLTGESGRELPTGSGVGTVVDMAGGLVGFSPGGSAEAQTLKAIGGALTSKMPRMQGPQSDKDTQLYKEMAAVVGDSTIPRERRIAALGKVKEIWGKYEDFQTGTNIENKIVREVQLKDGRIGVEYSDGTRGYK